MKTKLEKELATLRERYRRQKEKAELACHFAAGHKWEELAAAECERRGIKARFMNFGSPHNSMAPQWARDLHAEIEKEMLPRFMAQANTTLRKIKRLEARPKPKIKVNMAQVIQLEF
jgi:hypothetical protein